MSSFGGKLIILCLYLILDNKIIANGLLLEFELFSYYFIK